ncbi:MAG TPA: DUF6599 family protein, partial [Candidatus Nitrosotalea sp.]|nr:DUF6599 family protein [Candidatus Nitrosotalea sp.]
MTKLLVTLLLPAACVAGIWPDNFGAFHRTMNKPVVPSDRPLWDECALQQAEQAEYEFQARKFTGTAYRLQDSTGALAAFDWQRPPDAKPSTLGKLAVESGDSVTLAYGNYLLKFDGYKPSVGEIGTLVQTLPKLEQSPLPALSGYLPDKGLVPNSERYILGPVGLDKFAPAISPSTAAFHFGTEGQLGAFRSATGEMKLIIFSYPTPHIARERIVDFQRISGAMAKRAGPLIAVVLSPPNADDAERLLAQIRYTPTITLDEHVPGARDNIGNLVVNIFKLTGLLLVFCLVAGLSFGSFRALFLR